MAPAAVPPSKIVTGRQAIAFVRKYGVVLESSRGKLPSFAEAVAGAPIKGNWWSHPKGREIFALTRIVRDSDDVLVCRAADGKITFFHRRLWPALIRLADHFPRERLAQLREEHTPSGRHVVRTTAFPDWVPQGVAVLAGKLSESEALAQLGRLLA
jgi:hypothetical protein